MPISAPRSEKPILHGCLMLLVHPHYPIVFFQRLSLYIVGPHSDRSVYASYNCHKPKYELESYLHQLLYRLEAPLGTPCCCILPVTSKISHRETTSGDSWRRRDFLPRKFGPWDKKNESWDLSTRAVFSKVYGNPELSGIHRLCYEIYVIEW